MGTVVALFSKDPREAEFERVFGHSPAFVHYLTRRTIALQCSLEFVQWFGCALQSMTTNPPRKISADLVNRFDCDCFEKRVHQVTNQFSKDAKEKMVFTLMMLLLKCRKQTKLVYKRLARLFACAYAMIIGIGVDPSVRAA